MNRAILLRVLGCAAIVVAAGCTSPDAKPRQGASNERIRVAEISNGVVACVTSVEPEKIRMIKKDWAEKEKANRLAGGEPGSVYQPRRKVPAPVKAMVGSAKRSVKTVDMTALKAVIDAPKNSLLVDVREPFEYMQGHLPGAVNIPRGVVELSIWEKVGEPGETDPQLKIYLYCLRSGRAILAAKSLQEMGLKNVFAVDMKLQDWQRAGYSLE